MSTEILSAPTSVPKLIIARDDALASIKTQLEKGFVIRALKIRNPSELEKAREHKLEWTQSTLFILARTFESEEPAEDFNRWVGKILPEFAELPAFVEHFQDEMDQRLRKLLTIYKHVEAEPDIVHRKIPEPDVVHTKLADLDQVLREAAKDTPKPQPARTEAPKPEPAKIETPRTEPARAQALRTESPKPEPAGTETPRKAEEMAVSKKSEEVIDQPIVDPPAILQTPQTRPSPVNPLPVPAAQRPTKTRTGALIVHARNEAVEDGVTQFIQRLGFETILFAEQPDGAKGIIQRLEQNPQIAFAMILTSPDDAAAARQGGDAAAGRSDFELGYCAGKLGFDRVCVLHAGPPGHFHDRHGIFYIPVDPAEGWQLQLAKHLRRAGIEVDLNKLC